MRRSSSNGRGSRDLGRLRFVALDDVQDRAAEVGVRIDEVSAVGHAEVALDLVRVVAADLADLGGRPEVELAFDAFGVGILGCVEAARGVREVAEHVADDVFDDRAVAGFAGREIPVQVRAGQQRVVVQHLLEVRDEPRVVGGVRAKPPPRWSWMPPAAMASSEVTIISRTPSSPVRTSS